MEHCIDYSCKLLFFQIPALKEQLTEKEYQLEEMEHKFSTNKELLSQNLHQAAVEIRRQYEAIDSALDVSTRKYIQKKNNV